MLYAAAVAYSLCMLPIQYRSPQLYRSTVFRHYRALLSAMMPSDTIQLLLLRDLRIVV